MIKFYKNGLSVLLSLLNTQGKKNLIWSITFAVIEIALSVFPLLALYKLLLLLMAGATLRETLLWAVAVCITVPLKTIFHGISTRLSHKTAFETLYSIRSQMLEKLGRVPMGFLDENSTGKLKTQIMDDVETLEQFYAHNIPEMVAGVGVPLLMAIILVFIDFRLTLAMLIPIAIYLWNLQKMSKVQQQNFPQFFGSSQQLNTSMMEYLKGMKEIRIFSGEEKSFAKLQQASKAYKDYTVKWFRDSWHFMSINTVVITANIAFVLPIAGWLYLRGSINPATFLLFLFAALSFSAPLAKVAQYFDILSINVQTAQTIHDFLDIPELPAVETGEEEVPEGNTICFENVSFGYNEELVLHNLSFEAKQGTVTALVGSSGSGKSTIAKLTARFWDVSKGKITIGNADIRNIPMDKLYAKISFVTQNVSLFQMTVAENICLGNPNATQEEIITAAKAARCHDFIMELPQGYDTVLDQKVRALSGGEAQRIAIARAIIKNTSILILDEATAYADPDNEALLQEALSELSREKTTLVIAHRLTSVQHADQLLVLKDGEILEKGTHNELLSQPIYQKMWQAFLRSESWVAGKKEKEICSN